MIFASDPEKLFGKSPRDFVLQMAFCMIMVFVAFFVQAVIHEFGHLLFGLLTGYKFISFRIGNVMFIKESGKELLKEETKTVNKLFEEGNTIMMEMTSIVMKFAPIGVFCFCDDWRYDITVCIWNYIRGRI